MLPTLEVSADMDFWHPRHDIEQEEIDRYAAVVAAYVKEKKGWEPGEYRMRFIIAIADAPLAAFNVIHNKGLEELRQSPPKGQGFHPLEMQVYVQTEEMRAFDDGREYIRLIEEAREKKGKKP